MNSKVTIAVDAKRETLVRRALALAEEMEHLALAAPDGEVFDACEGAVVAKGRKFQAHVLGAALAQRIAAAEKKGRRAASVPAVAKKKTADPKNANS